LIFRTKRKKNFYASFLDKTLLVLVEGKRDKKAGDLRGFSRNYIPILFAGNDGLMGKKYWLRLKR